MLIALRPFARIAARVVTATVLTGLLAERCDAQAIPIVTGIERLHWDQPAATLDELDTLGYALYVDNARLEVGDASCAATASTAGFACDGALPPLSAGQHTLQIAAFVTARPDLESARSAQLLVAVGSTSTPEPPLSLVTSDGVTLQVDTVVRAKDAVNGVAATTDGALIVAERGGALAIHRNGVTIRDASALSDVAADYGGLLAVTPDRAFSSSHFVYVAYTSRSGTPDCVVRLARLRESSGTFGDRIVIFENPLASPARSAALRFATDGTLYFGINDIVVRLNADGTTPVGQPGMNPTVATGFASLGGLDWQPASGWLWAADGISGGVGQLARVATNVAATINTAGARLAALPSAMTFYNRDAIPPFQGNAFVASYDGQVLLRIRFDEKNPSAANSIESLLAQQIGGIRAVAVGTDGLLYLGTAQSVIRLLVTSR